MPWEIIIVAFMLYATIISWPIWLSWLRNHKKPHDFPGGKALKYPTMMKVRFSMKDVTTMDAPVGHVVAVETIKNRVSDPLVHVPIITHILSRETSVNFDEPVQNELPQFPNGPVGITTAANSRSYVPFRGETGVTRS